MNARTLLVVTIAVLGAGAVPTPGDSPAAATPSVSAVAPDSTAAVAPDSTAADTLAAPLTAPPPRVRLVLTPNAGEKPTEPRELSGTGFERHTWDRDHDLRTWARYNRVEGLALFAGIRRPLERRTFLPSYHAELGYAFSAERAQYRIGFEQPVAPLNKITVGAEGYRLFDPFFYQEETVSAEENTASALFLHRDYWDWYEAEGMRAFVGLRPSPFLSLEAGVRTQDERALHNRADWSVFRQTEDFTVNPLIPSGRYRAWEASLTFDSRPRNDRGDTAPRAVWGGLEHWVRLSWERAGADLGGDANLWRATADLRAYYRLSARQQLAVRILGGTGRSEDGVLPVHRRFALGGLGTLRGHNYRSLTGDHVALANLEYGFGMGRHGWLLFFVDAGSAWDRGALFDRKVSVDAGTGFRLGDEGLTLLLARPVNESGAEAKAYIRLKESF